MQTFSFQLMDNLLSLHHDLATREYRHSVYEAFKVNDPKPRQIHKASVRDRLLHHALYRILYPFFDRTFIVDSYSCRIGKGVHRSLNRFRSFGRKVSNNHTRTVWILKCDVRKCFASVDQDVLMNILKKHIADPDTLWLLERVITSFDSGTSGRGLPLGNLTSQLLINIYLNEFDQFAKQQLKAKYYIRYADDFVVFSKNENELKNILILMDAFLRLNLRLELHPDKVFIRTVASGVDFLGWVHFSDHRVLRAVTKRRMFRKLDEKNLSSYSGLLKHGNGHRLRVGIEEKVLIDRDTTGQPG
ncbi:MAG: reverse transcriptase/maturase family protein [Candidatus Moraniibacteriota bacterium]